ncbi:MAG TPA: azurin [Daejeonella sp.]|nr:azurin [Daejeonella sp.]
MKKVTLLTAIAIPVLLASCGGNQQKTAEHETAKVDTSLPAVTTPAPSASTEVSNTVEISGNDQMKFDKTTIRVKAGEKVTLTIKDIGTMPKEAMSHNFVLLKNGTDPEKFAMQAMTSKETDYIPASMKSSVLAHTKTVGPGESDTIEFTVPKGEYEFICSFPGHWSTMRGKLIAE